MPILKKRSYKRADCVLGGRFESRSCLIGYSKKRILGNHVFNLIYSLAAGKSIRDMGSGLNMYSTNMLKSKFYIGLSDSLYFNAEMLLFSAYYNVDFFYWSTMSILKYNPDCDVTFVVLKEHIEKFDIKNRILSYFPQARVEVIPEVLAGAVLTCMAGVENINDDRPVLFNDCDHMFCCSEFNFMDKKSAAK